MTLNYEPTIEEYRAVQMVKAALKVYNDLTQDADGEDLEGVDIHGIPEVFLAAMALMSLACMQGRTATSVTGQASTVMGLALSDLAAKRI